MKNLSRLCEKVLSFIEPDSSKWKDWIEKKDFYPISQSEGMQDFVEKMRQIKEVKSKVLVAGDYDCDGIMATTIMVNGLKKYGIDVGFYIPDRIKEGYGLSVNTVNLAYKKGYKTIVTVDNGVKAIAALERAASLGIQTIVTDHHTMDEFVECDCLVHQSEMEDCFSSLCGAGIAYECLRALRVDTEFDLMCACVASIGDVMAVTKQTRVIIQKGIEALNRTQEVHFMSLCNDKTVNEVSIAFQIVPKLNAVGRLSDVANANNVVRYFLQKQNVQKFAIQIDAINAKRKNMSQAMVQEVMQKCDVEEDILFVCDDTYHEGLIGLAAGSICSQFHKPSIIATSRDGMVKASMRAPNGFNCMDFLNEFDLFETCGGHAQAAGFSFLDENLKEFKDYIYTKIEVYDWQEQEIKALPISSNELSLAQVQSLDVLRPFGNEFEMPVFEIEHPNIQSVFDIQNGKHRKYTIDNGLQCMNFNQSLQDLRSKNRMIASMMGSIQINVYQQRKSVNFIIDKISYVKQVE